MSTARPANAGISGPTPSALRANPMGRHRFQFTPLVKVGRMLEGARYFFGNTYMVQADGGFTMTGELGNQRVIVTFSGYTQNGPTGQGQATIELAADYAARQSKPVAAATDGAGAAPPAK